MIKQHIFKNCNVRVFQQRKTGMNCCGDSYFIKETNDFIICGIADGLGSGQYAKEASMAAMEEVSAFANEPLKTIMEKVNESQINLRGVVMSLFKIDIKSRQGYFCGIGNINVLINDDHETLYRQLIPTRGYISGKPIPFNVQEFDFPEEGWFALYSDGIQIQAKRIEQLYRILECPDEKKAVSHIGAYSALNSNDDATLLIGKFI